MDAQLKEELNPALSAANDASGKVRAQHLTFVLFLVYFSLIIASTTDKQLLLISPVNLPMINVKLPLREFYVIAPWILVFLHFHLLVQFYLLSQNLHRYKKILSKVNDFEDLESWTNRLSAFAFNHLIINRQHRRIMRVVLAAIILATVIVLPLTLLVWAQARFIPYQSEAITSVHRIVLLVDVMVLWLMWPRIVSPQDAYVEWWKGPPRKLWRYGIVIYRITMSHHPLQIWKVLARWRCRYNSFVSSQWGMIAGLTFLTILFSLFVIVIPNGRMEVRVSQLVPESWLYVDNKRVSVPGFKNIVRTFDLNGGVANNRYFSLTHWFFDFPGQPFRQSLFIRNEVLASGADSIEVENLLRSDDEADREKGLKKIRGLQLQERSLRYADFAGSLLLKANLGPEEKPDSSYQIDNQSNSRCTDIMGRGADLRGAYLESVQLQEAKLGGARLQGIYLGYAQLQGANLSCVNLNRATFWETQLQGAILTNAKLEGAHFRRSQLQGAVLTGANLEGIGFIQAQLQGANLEGVDLRRAGLVDAQLQGANLSQAKLQDATISSALQDAVFWKTNFGERSPKEVSDLIEKGEAIRCDDNKEIKKCNLTDAVNIWIKISCENIESAKGVVRNYRHSLIGKGKKYYSQYNQGLGSKECQLTADQKDELTRELNNFDQ